MANTFLPLGGGDEIGASSYLYTVAGHGLLIDAGMRMHADRTFPDFAPLFSAIGGFHALRGFLLTHAHLDHCGALLRLQYEAPHLAKFATAATADLTQIMLGDALRLSGRRGGEDWGVRRQEFSRGLLQAAIDGLQPVTFGQPFLPLGGDVQVTPLPAGHILGAASFLIEAGDCRILHTGDLCLHDQHTIPGAGAWGDLGKLHLLVIEATYAYQPAHKHAAVEEERYHLGRQVQAVVAAGGRVLIPSFALGRAQEIVAMFRDWFEQGLIDPFPVRVDGLVRPVTDAYAAHKPLLRGRLGARVGHPIYDDWVQPMADGFYPHARAAANLPPMCVISSSGMLIDRTRSAAYAQAFLPTAEDAILFSGYVDGDSPGGRLVGLAANSADRINGREVPVRARVDRYRLSAHASSADLRRIIQRLAPEQVILIHGNYRFSPDADFTRFLLQAEKDGIQVHHAANGVPIYF
jgi:integrator complex subunit 11